jgi:hypothetical protein
MANGQYIFHLAKDFPSRMVQSVPFVSETLSIGLHDIIMCARILVFAQQLLHRGMLVQFFLD